MPANLRYNNDLSDSREGYFHYYNKKQVFQNSRHIGQPHSTWYTTQICNTYHGIPTVGSSTSTSANDFVYAFFVDGSIAFW